MSPLYPPSTSFPNSTYSSVYFPPSFGEFGSTTTANLLQYVSVNIDFPDTITGIQWVNENPVGSNGIVALYSAAGAILGSSSSTAQSSTFAVQPVPFTTPVPVAAGSYFLALITNGGTGQFGVARFFATAATAAQGSFAAPSTITPPSKTTRTGNVPLLGTY